MKNQSKLLGSIISLAISMPILSACDIEETFSPETYLTCALERVKEAQSDAAARSILELCEFKHSILISALPIEGVAGISRFNNQFTGSFTNQSTIYIVKAIQITLIARESNSFQVPANMPLVFWIPVRIGPFETKSGSVSIASDVKELLSPASAAQNEPKRYDWAISMALAVQIE